ncbi:hypothetical protein CUU80_10330 [Bifidobacterium scaligerum]|uniref:Glycosyl hydrolase n=2 Tax=Bifidobacterium scaligerum TaxID=2052656 RepID=A0A2M9HNC1_9BIFI|nr:hypothetical protein CUU80_10330 [Bifidobacterium scaligerum]
MCRFTRLGAMKRHMCRCVTKGMTMKSDVRYRGFELPDVTLTGGEFFRRQMLVRDYVLQFDLDRLMHTFRTNAGFKDAAEPLGGWESPDCGLRGHFVGHFLSAASKFYAAYGADETVDNVAGDATDSNTPDDDTQAEIRDRFKTIVDHIVDVMAQCAQPNGYLAAFPESELDRLESKDYRKVWAPYYTLHKILQGLVDAYRYTDNETALQLARGLAGYIGRRLSGLGAWKIDNMLRPTRLNPLNEYGGIGDALYALYDITHDADVLATAKIFDREYFLGPMTAGEDVLEDLHANTHLPQIIAAEHRYDITGEERYRTAAEHFAEFLDSRTFANGSNSSKATHFTLEYGVSDKAEHWGAAGDLHDALTFGESESCNGHNTERIMSRLFSWTGDIRYADWLARLKFNAVLNCFSPRNGLSQYHQPMGCGAYKIFSTPTDTFWCCTASGVEAASELARNIWFEAVPESSVEPVEDGGTVPTVAVTSFVPSRLHWRDQGVTCTLDTDYPASDRATLCVTFDTCANACGDACADAPRRLAFVFRAHTVEGASVPLTRAADGFARIERDWHNGESITLHIAPDWHTESLRGAPNRVAVLHGDVLMAKPDADINVGDLPAAGEALAARAAAMHMRPLYDIAGHERYSVYLNTDAEHPITPVEFSPVAEGSNDPQ